MSNICIVYSSTHHGNTEKVLNKIKEKFPETVLIKAGDFNPDDFNRYEAIGFASGIFYFKFAKPVDKLFEQALVSSVQKLFLFTPPERSMPVLKKLCAKKPNKAEKSVWAYSAAKALTPSVL